LVSSATSCQFDRKSTVEHCTRPPPSQRLPTNHSSRLHPTKKSPVLCTGYQCIVVLAQVSHDSGLPSESSTAEASSIGARWMTESETIEQCQRKKHGFFGLSHHGKVKWTHGCGRVEECLSSSRVSPITSLVLG
jgi:hypothetical protein